MIDPEPANAGIWMGQRVSIGRQAMGEIGRVEIDADLPGSRPVDPVFKVCRFESIALDLAAAGLGITGMEVQPDASRVTASGPFPGRI